MKVPRASVRSVATVAVLATVGAVSVALHSVPPAQAVAVNQVWVLPSSGSFTVVGHGNGHGHGLSQYGARGAAIAGLTAGQIVGFYYQGTTLRTLGSVAIKVQISSAATYPTVKAAAGLRVTGIATPLSTASATQYRLVPNGASHLALQARVNSAWTTVRTGLPTRADFAATAGYVRMIRADNTSTDYWGTVGGVLSGTSVVTVNTTTLEHYTAGVTPREMPASWQAAAVQAQAIAARTYGYYHVVHPASSLYHICDTTMCQVYGGKTHYDAAGNVLWQDYAPAANATVGRVVFYNGAVIFAQFSASNGGWTVDGGQPYLVAKRDPYNNAASGDPYLNWSKSVSVASLARAYGLARVTAVKITERDGHGDWGGRVLSATVYGSNSAGTAQQIPTTGFRLQSALGVLHNWMSAQLLPAGADPVGYIKSVFPLLTGRAPDSTALNTYVSMLRTGTPAINVTTAITRSPLGRSWVVTNLVVGHLHRGPAPVTVRNWTAYLAAGHSVLDAESEIVGSDYYYQLVGGTPQKFVQSLYTSPLILGTTPDPTTVANWVSAMQSGTTRVDVARAFLKSVRRVNLAVRVAYHDVLKRTADAAGLAAWSARFPAYGYDRFVLRAGLASSIEYRAPYRF